MSRQRFCAFRQGQCQNQGECHKRKDGRRLQCVRERQPVYSPLIQKLLHSLSIILFTSIAIGSWAESGQALQSFSAAKSTPVFVIQDNFWVNLNHFLRTEARRHSSSNRLEMPIASFKPGERTEWESALAAYTDLAQRSYIFDQTLTEIDNILATQSSQTISGRTTIGPKFVVALNRAAPIYREYRWNQDHTENQQWIKIHSPAIVEHASHIKEAIGKLFGIKPPEQPILVDVVREIGPNLAYTTQGPVGFSGHTFISAQVNKDPDVALDTILHEISHTMDDQIIAIINDEAARQKVRIPPDMWHAVTLYSTSELVRRELGRGRSDPTYAPNTSFSRMFAEGTWHSIFTDLQAYWLPHLNGKENLDHALAAVISNAPQ